MKISESTSKRPNKSITWSPKATPQRGALSAKLNTPNGRFNKEKSLFTGIESQDILERVENRTQNKGNYIKIEETTMIGFFLYQDGKFFISYQNDLILPI